MSYRVITAKLKARTAVHIGSGEGTDITDALIRRDTAGQPVIPGTAIAGALRALLTRLAPRLGGGTCQALKGGQASCGCGVCHLFGDVNPSDEPDASSQASRLLVFNARLNGKNATLIRDGVGIDRVTGAAARAGAVKFDLEVLPAGAEFDLRLELRDANIEDEQLLIEDEQLLAAALAEWQAGRAWLGGRVARGLGAFDLTDIEYGERDLNQPDQLLAFLGADEPWRQAKETSDWLDTRIKEARGRLVDGFDTSLPVARRWVSFEGTLQAQGPLLTNDTVHAGISGFDHAPLLIQLGDWSHPVLTGAGLRGVLRSHAERIARTLATLEAQNGDDFKRTCPACDPTARRLKKDVPPEELPSLESCDSLLLYQAGKGGNDPVEQKELCLACRLFGSTRLGSRLLVEDAPYASQTPPKFKMLDFLAVDRFTGGGAEKLKFDALALWRPAFKLRFHLDNPQDWELGWLALVLRDLAEGWLSVGYGAAKGFGCVKLTDWTARFGYLGPDDAPALKPMPKTETEGVYTVVKGDASQPDAWLNRAEDWVEAFYKKVTGKTRQGKREGTGFRRPDKMVLKQDDYFRQEGGKRVHELYPKEVKVEVKQP